MARKQSGIAMDNQIEPMLSAPLDGRTQVKLKSDLTDPASYPYSYVGLPVGCREDGRLYVLTAKDTTNAENWKKVAFVEDGSGDEHVEITAEEVAALFDDTATGG